MHTAISCNFFLDKASPLCYNIVKLATIPVIRQKDFYALSPRLRRGKNIADFLMPYWNRGKEMGGKMRK